RPDLHRRGVSAQHEPGAIRPLRQVERVVLLPCRVLGRDVESGEVVEILLDMRPLGYCETHLPEDRHDLVDCLADRVDASGPREPPRRGAVAAPAGEPLFELGATETRRSL